MVGTVVGIKIAVNTVLEVTVVNPDVVAALQGQVVIAVDVVGTGTLEGDVANDDVLTVLQHEDSTLGNLAGVLAVDEGAARKSVDSFVLCILDRLDTADADVTFDVDGLLCCTRHSRNKFAHRGNGDSILVATTGNIAANSCPTNRSTLVVRGTGAAG